MSTKIDDSILVEYLKGRLDIPQSEEVEVWFQASEENKKYLEELYFFLFVSERVDVMMKTDTEQALREFTTKYMKPEESSAKIIKKHSSFYYWRAIAVAAILVGVFFSVNLFISNIISKYNSQLISVSTAQGERAQVTLPDGTKVWLNACTKITYRSSFNQKEREVNMDGEAYFEVSKHKNLPFIVKNSDFRIKVLGTKFNLRCNHDDDYVEATLLEGSILFSDAKKDSDVGVIMKPNEKIYLDKQTHRKNIQQTDAMQSADWITGKLTFERKAFADIASDLERQYNISITFSDNKLKKEQFTAEFNRQDNIYQILSILALTNKFQYSFDRRNVTISPKQLK